jgi:hypothetical protein
MTSTAEGVDNWYQCASFDAVVKTCRLEQGTTGASLFVVGSNYTVFLHVVRGLQHCVEDPAAVIHCVIDGGWWSDRTEEEKNAGKKKSQVFCLLDGTRVPATPPSAASA